LQIYTRKISKEKLINMPSQRRMSAGAERGDSGGRMQRALDLPCGTVAAVAWRSLWGPAVQDEERYFSRSAHFSVARCGHPKASF